MTSYSESSFEKKRLSDLMHQSVVALPGNLLMAGCMVLLLTGSFLPDSFCSGWRP